MATTIRKVGWLAASGVLLAACAEDRITGGEPISFSISASHDRITTPGRITLTAEADRPLVRVEIYEGSRKVGESTGNLAQHRIGVAVTKADNGRHTYVAKGHDASGSVATSNPVTVEVDVRWEWVRHLEGIAVDAVAVAADATGAAYLAATTADRPFDAILAKYDGDGNPVWTRRFGGADWERAGPVGVDVSGRVYLTGMTWAASNPGGSVPPADCYLVIYDAAVSPVWTQRIGTPQDSEGGCVAASDRSGNFYLAGIKGRATVFLAKYDRDGNNLWTRELTTESNSASDGVLDVNVAVDPLGGVYVAGSTSGSMDVSPNRGGWDVFVVKFDDMGTRLWTKQLGTARSEFVHGVGADPDGGVYLAGHRGETPASDVLLARYGADGTLLWTRQLDGGSLDMGKAVAADRTAVYLVGRTDAGPEARPDLTEPPQGLSALFLAKLSREGVLLSVRLLDGAGYGSEGTGPIAFAGNGIVYVAAFRTHKPDVPDAAVLARHREGAP
jgi:hypothetical protein